MIGSRATRSNEMESINTKEVGERGGVGDTKKDQWWGGREEVMEVMLDLQGWNLTMLRDHWGCFYTRHACFVSCPHKHVCLCAQSITVGGSVHQQYEQRRRNRMRCASPAARLSSFNIYRVAQRMKWAYFLVWAQWSQAWCTHAQPLLLPHLLWLFFRCM